MVKIYQVLSKEDKRELVIARQAKANKRGNWRAVDRYHAEINAETSAYKFTK